MPYFKVDQCFVMNGFFSAVRLPIISYGGLTVSGGGSMTVRAAALQRTDRLQIGGDRIFGNEIGLIALIQWSFPETSAARPVYFQASITSPRR